MRAFCELDVRVATEVMGVDYVGFDTGVPPYSTDMNAALMVFEHLRMTIGPAPVAGYTVIIPRPQEGRLIQVTDISAPKAICLAALQAVEKAVHAESV